MKKIVFFNYQILNINNHNKLLPTDIIVHSYFQCLYCFYGKENINDSISIISKKVGLDSKTVNSSIKRLEKLGMLDRENKIVYCYQKDTDELYPLTDNTILHLSKDQDRVDIQCLGHYTTLDEKIVYNKEIPIGVRYALLVATALSWNGRENKPRTDCYHTVKGWFVNSVFGSRDKFTNNIKKAKELGLINFDYEKVGNRINDVRITNLYIDTFGESITN